MTALIGVALAIAVLVSAGLVFLRTDAAKLARGLRLAGPAALALFGFVLIVLGRVAIGAPLLVFGLGGVAASLAGRRALGGGSTARKRSTVRTAAIEMELDHETGALEGLVLAGRFEQRTLGSLSLKDLLAFRGELAGDGESRQLLETYLDGRFPTWRKDADADGGDGQGGAPRSGPMSKEEAYKVLGLETGASAADVRQAHRRLMQRLHPDVGGSSFLAARINEAKDILLSDHE
jgi:hypothetical protein